MPHKPGQSSVLNRCVETFLSPFHSLERFCSAGAEQATPFNGPIHSKINAIIFCLSFYHILIFVSLRTYLLGFLPEKTHSIAEKKAQFSP
tara:strand:- start:611 stop:880 length:270 start_codon:yes stop_codon:yes gene_type:complete